ncbi:MAG: metallophosphoesterase [Candidatus Zixiibacteriota bacterium]|nr:MAG: metallophosphoesterase [candidate division Zixibacteria bacterium]
MRSLIVITLLFVLAAAPVSSQVDSTDSAQGPIDLTDGPHVYWQNDSNAIVFYLCDGEVFKDTLQATDSLKFNGFCRDSAEFYSIPCGEVTIEPHINNNVSRIFAVSDVHGEYEFLRSLLINSSVINEAGDWTWGDGHLVIVGDVFDRGDKVTECLWLIHRLEQQAKAVGGRVHFVLGNHELMVIRGDNRYVHQRYLDGICRKTRIKHEDLFGPDMALGRWLRSKHTAVKINDILFVHGGIPPFMVGNGWNLDQLNSSVRRHLDLRSSQAAFSDTARMLFGSAGPLWYRGYHYGMEGKYEQACSTAVDSVLSACEASTIVIGHSECAAVHGIYGHRIIAIDIPVEDIGSLQGVLWQDDVFYLVTGDGQRHPIQY